MLCCILVFEEDGAVCRLLVDRGTYDLCLDWSMVHREASTQWVEMGGMMYGVEICFSVESCLIYYLILTTYVS